MCASAEAQVGENHQAHSSLISNTTTGHTPNKSTDRKQLRLQIRTLARSQASPTSAETTCVCACQDRRTYAWKGAEMPIYDCFKRPSARMKVRYTAAFAPKLSWLGSTAQQAVTPKITELNWVSHTSVSLLKFYSTVKSCIVGSYVYKLIQLCTELCIIWIHLRLFLL